MRTAFRGYEYERSNIGRVSRGGAKHVFKPRDVVNRRIADILADNGLFKETAELRDSFAKSFKRYQDLVQDGFTQQYRVTGRLLFSTTNNGRTQVPSGVENRKVIHDLENTRDDLCFENPAFDVPAHGDAVPVPVHPIARVFDLKTHGFCWVNADFMTPYVYDESLRDKLVLPETHRDLLDVLTTDLDVLTSDIIEGKTAGNIILAVGKPGLGKTLSAEVYAELTHKPLYSVRSGELGTTVETVSKGLSELFQRCKRWGAVLLLDEADVFVMRRDDNIGRNAIVAEFLRTLEYFEGLMFMTSNREHDIDEAVIQRCAAIIRYGAPDEAHVRQIWAVMEELFKVKLGEQLIDQLIGAFPSIAPRDMKMVMRLAIRYATKKERELSLDVFTTCALFRNIAVHSDREPSLQHGSQ